MTGLRIPFASLLLGCAFPALLSAQLIPIGTEFHVNTFTTELQVRPVVAPFAGGGFVVVWDSRYQDGSDEGIFGQLYDSAGATLGTEFQINTYTTGGQQSPQVAPETGGGFVVVWSDDTQDGGGGFGQHFDSSGAPLGTEFQINASGGGDVALQSSGGSVIVWERAVLGYPDVFGQRYDSLGIAVGTEFQINTYTTGGQLLGAVAGTPDGGFVVVWSNTDDGSDGGVFGQLYDSSGSAIETEFRINTYTTGFQFQPHVSSDANGFVVVWTSRQDGDNDGVFGQRYDDAGSPIGTEFQVNTYTTDYQFQPKVAFGNDGRFTVAWTSTPGQDGSQHGVFGQAFNSCGDPVGTEFQINTFTAASQSFLGLEIGAQASGDLVVVWESSAFGQEGGPGIYGQRFGPASSPAPCTPPPTATPTMIPTPTPTSPNQNHYLCRQVKDLKVPAKFGAVPGITVIDQTGNDACEAKKPFLLCDPVDKNGGGVIDPALHYCCYKLKCTQRPAVSYGITDQFWNGTISTKKPKFLCNPCQKAPAP